MSGNYTTPNPPFGAVLTYNARQPLEEGQALVMVITDDDGEEVREMELDGEAGMHRVAWNLRANPPEQEEGGGRGGRGGFGGGRGGGQGPIVEPARYHAQLGIKTGEGDEATVQPVGPPQSFRVVPLD
jgi:hypothetical protein